VNFPAEEEPDGDVMAPHHFYIGIMAAVFGFTFIWPYYPLSGATAVLIGTAILLDDVLSHVFGMWTPLDWLFKVAMKRGLVR
jgi:hypothetical protein